MDAVKADDISPTRMAAQPDERLNCDSKNFGAKTAKPASRNHSVAAAPHIQRNGMFFSRTKQALGKSRRPLPKPALAEKSEPPCASETLSFCRFFEPDGKRTRKSLIVRQNGKGVLRIDAIGGKVSKQGWKGEVTVQSSKLSHYKHVVKETHPLRTC